MLKNKIKFLTITNSILLIVMVCLFVFKSFFSNDEIVYVDNNRLFNGFNMTKDLKRTGALQFKVKKATIDSLYFKIQNIKGIERQYIMKEFITKKEELEKFNQEFAYQESQKIWKRLHSYIDEFSGLNSYQLIIGSENEQTVLHASSKLDKTNDLINYVNLKYEGAK